MHDPEIGIAPVQEVQHQRCIDGLDREVIDRLPEGIGSVAQQPLDRVAVPGEPAIDGEGVPQIMDAWVGPLSGHGAVGEQLLEVTVDAGVT